VRHAIGRAVGDLAGDDAGVAVPYDHYVPQVALFQH
jgi:hypothetical protein